VVVEEKELTNEELKELHDTDPLKAIEYMNERAVKRAERNLETRLAPIMAGSTSSAEAAARQRYPEEFALFGDQISRLVSEMPNAKTVFTNPQAWDDAISWVRGKSENLERLFERRQGKKSEIDLPTAQHREAESVGFTTQSPRPRSAPQNVMQMDATMREIARNLDMSDEDYIKWYKM
jgi:hypothetical protein